MKLKIKPLTEKDFDILIMWASGAKELLIWAGPNLKYPLTHEQLKKYIEPSIGNDPECMLILL